MNINQYNLISFDLWGTLIKGHPEHKANRAKYFHTHYNPYVLSENEVYNAIRSIDIQSNSASEIMGIGLKPQQYIYNVLNALGNKPTDFGYLSIGRIYKDLSTIFLEFLPSLYPGSKELLQHLSKKSKARLVVVSNTGFMGGDVMRVALDLLGIDHYFMALVFSDEMGYAKPSHNIFSDRAARRVIHIGDSLIADVGYARSIGADHLVVNNSDVPVGINSLPTIEDLIKQIKNERQEVSTN